MIIASSGRLCNPSKTAPTQIRTLVEETGSFPNFCVSLCWLKKIFVCLFSTYIFTCLGDDHFPIGLVVRPENGGLVINVYFTKNCYKMKFPAPLRKKNYFQKAIDDIEHKNEVFRFKATSHFFRNAFDDLENKHFEYF